MRTVFLTLVCAFLLGPALAAAQPAAGRAALVIGQGAYAAAGSAEGAGSDAAKVAAALVQAGWRVSASANLDKAGLDAAAASFAGTVRPGDAVLVYYSGLALKAPAAIASEGLDNYLLGVDADGASAPEAAKRGLALSALASRLNRAGAQAPVMIIDAARPNQLEPRWGAAAGLAEPSTEALRNAFLIFPAGPGQLAREGLFGPALVLAIGKPGATVGQSALDLAAAIDRDTGGGQSPWSSGAAAAAKLSLNAPRGAAAAVSDDQLFAQAVACGAELCLRQAAAQVRAPGRGIDLLLRAEVASVEMAPAAAPPRPTPANYVDGFIEANRATPEGMSRIGRNYLTGADGFPKDAARAYPWLMRAATGGDAYANTQVGLIFDEGLPPVGNADKYAAAPHFKTAAEKGDATAQAKLAGYYERGEGGLPADPALAASWRAKAQQRR